MTAYLPATDMPRFVRELMDFVGFAERDAATVRASAPVVLARETEFTTALYAPDAARLERRKHSLGRWLREMAQAAVTHDAISLSQMALAQLFADTLGDARAALEASIAWNKLLCVHLNVLLLGYTPPTPR